MAPSAHVLASLARVQQNLNTSYYQPVIGRQQFYAQVQNNTRISNEIEAIQSNEYARQNLRNSSPLSLQAVGSLIQTIANLDSRNTELQAQLNDRPSREEFQALQHEFNRLKVRPTVENLQSLHEQLKEATDLRYQRDIDHETALSKTRDEHLMEKTVLQSQLQTLGDQLEREVLLRRFSEREAARMEHETALMEAAYEDTLMRWEEKSAEMEVEYLTGTTVLQSRLQSMRNQMGREALLRQSSERETARLLQESLQLKAAKRAREETETQQTSLSESERLLKQARQDATSNAEAIATLKDSRTVLRQEMSFLQAEHTALKESNSKLHFELSSSQTEHVALKESGAELRQQFNDRLE
ncbi:hypothetical protein EJ07DRAFT_157718 [Lizonia empirigonia]|nr:hypothetical protein EJ07DRAFT_157718 [Lizonia empirigonia]